MTASRPSEKRGSTAIDERVINKIVMDAVDNVPGTVRLERLGRRNYPRIDSHVDSEFRTCSVEVFIASVFPAPVTTVAEACRRSVAGAIHAYTDYTCESVSVVVGSVVTDKGSVTIAELQHFNPDPVPTPVRTARTLKLRPVTTTSLYPNVNVPVNTAPREELTPIRTQPRPQLTPVSVLPRPQVRKISAPQPLSERGLTPVRVPRRQKPLSVSAPQPVTAISVSAPPPVKVQPITINRSISPRSVSAPGVVRPRSVSAPGVHARSVSAPRATQPRSVRTPAGRALTPVRRPQTHKPRPIVVQRRTSITPVSVQRSVKAAKRRNLR